MCASAGGRGVDVAVLGSIARGLRPTAVPTHEYQPSSRLRCGAAAAAARAASVATTAVDLATSSTDGTAVLLYY